MSDPRQYRYVGPEGIRAAISPAWEGQPIGSSDDLASWLTTVPMADRAEPYTFVVTVQGVLRLAPRRSEHVACAGGEPVLSAGEITFALDVDGWVAVAASNQSTGYCPDIESWPAVAEACERAGLRHPGEFTTGFVFRHCPECQQLNLVKEEDYTCAFCDAALESTK